MNLFYNASIVFLSMTWISWVCLLTDSDSFWQIVIIVLKTITFSTKTILSF